MDPVLKIVIPGPPVIQQRPRLGKYKNFYDPSSSERKILATQLLAGRQQCGIFAPLSGDLSVRIAFHFAPKGRRPDLSNMLKALEDSGNKILWQDDHQITHVDAWKYKSEEAQERTEIEVMKL